MWRGLVGPCAAVRQSSGNSKWNWNWNLSRNFRSISKGKHTTKRSAHTHTKRKAEREKLKIKTQRKIEAFVYHSFRAEKKLSRRSVAKLNRMDFHIFGIIYTIYVERERENNGLWRKNCSEANKNFAKNGLSFVRLVFFSFLFRQFYTNEKATEAN